MSYQFEQAQLLNPAQPLNQPNTTTNIFALEPVSLIHVLTDIFQALTQRALAEFPDKAVKIACENVKLVPMMVSGQWSTYGLS